MTEEQARQQLEELRVQINEMDRRIVELLNVRTRIVESIGQVKREAGLPVYEPKREDQVFANVLAVNGGPLGPDALRRIFERVIDEMRRVQRVLMESDGAK